MFNATILNGLSLTGKLEGPPVWTPADEGGRLLDVQVGRGSSRRRWRAKACTKCKLDAATKQQRRDLRYCRMHRSG